MLAIQKHLLNWFAREASEEEEDRADSAYIRMARNDASFRPLRDVLAEIEAEERGEVRSPVKQAG